MYILDEHGKHVLNGMITMVKRSDKKILLTCTHQLINDKTCYVAQGEKMIELTFTHHYKPDMSAMIAPKSMVPPGPLMGIGLANTNEIDYVLYSRNVATLEPVSVYCSSASFDSYDDPVFIHHKSDTYPGQCGSPYVSNNLVVALHNMSDNTYNKGLIIPAKVFTDF